MSYQVRELPREEWARLDETPLRDISQEWLATDARVLVVEDENGKIVGHWGTHTARHLEGLGIEPEHRKRGAVARLLWREMKRLVQGLDRHHVLTAADTEEVRALLAHVGAQRIPADFYCLAVTKE